MANQLQAKQNVADGLWEDIHWLFLAMGHLIADDVDSSEQRYIPDEIMKCSVASKAGPTNDHNQRSVAFNLTYFIINVVVGILL